MKLISLLPLVSGRYGPGSVDISAASYGPGGAGRDKMLQCAGMIILKIIFD